MTNNKLSKRELLVMPVLVPLGLYTLFCLIYLGLAIVFNVSLVIASVTALIIYLSVTMLVLFLTHKNESKGQS